MERKYYFTYGSSDNFPYQCGWTKVIAESRAQAIAVFRAAHPDKHEGFVNCAFIYDEEAFKKSGMLEAGNGGAKEVEVLGLYREVKA